MSVPADDIISRRAAGIAGDIRSFRHIGVRGPAGGPVHHKMNGVQIKKTAYLLAAGNHMAASVLVIDRGGNHVSCGGVGQREGLDRAAAAQLALDAAGQLAFGIRLGPGRIAVGVRQVRLVGVDHAA